MTLLDVYANCSDGFIHRCKETYPSSAATKCGKRLHAFSFEAIHPRTGVLEMQGERCQECKP